MFMTHPNSYQDPVLLMISGLQWFMKGNCDGTVISDKAMAVNVLIVRIGSCPGR